MDLLKMILNANGGQNIQQLASQFGIDPSQAQSAVEKLAPAVARGLKREASNESGLQSLVGALTKGNHERYLEDPSTLTRPESVSDGNRILGHIFGSKDVSRNVAAHAAQQTGLDTGILKKMLPLVATMVMGGMSKGTKQASGLSSAISGALGGGSNPLGALGSLLEQDDDGSMLDDVLNMAKKLF